MRIGAGHPRRVRVAIVAAALAIAALCSLAPSAQAASPAWKLLGATGPTNVPPRQSEVQQAIVEAEGGSFIATRVGDEGEGSPVVTEGTLAYVEGSPVATIESVAPGASFGVGDRITEPGAYTAGEEITVLSCSPNCESPGSTITLSAAAPETRSNVTVEVFTRELIDVSGNFSVGEEITGSVAGYPFPVAYFPPGTYVTSVDVGTLTLSHATSFEYLSEEPVVGLVATELSGPVVFDASAQELQEGLEEMPALAAAGSVTVSGGPGGTAADPYSIAFGGQFAGSNVPQLAMRTAGLEGLHAAVHVSTIVPGGPGTAAVAIAPVDIGGAAVSGEYAATLGPLPSGIVIAGPAEGEGWSCPEAAGEVTIECTSTTEVPRLTPANGLTVPIEVGAGAPTHSTVNLSISGVAPNPATYEMPINVSSEQASPGAQAFWAGAFNADGEEETQAGGHPYSAQTYFLLDTVRSKNGYVNPAGDSRDVTVDLSPGFIGDPLVLPRCSQSQLIGEPSRATASCNGEMAIGNFEPILSTFNASTTLFATEIFNDEPAFGSAAEFTTEIAAPLQSLLASVRSESDYGVRITAPNNPNYEKIYGTYAALEGDPVGAHGKAFLTNASDCANEAANPPAVVTSSDTWQEPGVFTGTSAALPPVVGCNKVEFHPSLTFRPSTSQGSVGSGATAQLNIPQEGLIDPSRLASADLKRAVVQLPSGVTLNASSANGLQACSEEEIGYRGSSFPAPNPIRFTTAVPTCPDGSKLGTVKIKTPLLDHELEGTIYLAAQEENPFHSLVAIYLAIDDPASGIVLKLPGEVQIDRSTGQLTAVFDNNPQLPFEELTLSFRGGGPQSELATPEVCGHYATTGSLTPWSAPESGPPAQIEESGFNVSSGCASSAGTRPFSPSFEAGTTGTQAGTYTPLVVKVGRKDGEQELTSLNFTLPEGLIGKLAGIPYCSDAAIAAAEHKTGKEEQADPSCPGASQIGTVDTSAGVGSEPFHVGGDLYLAGPYKGAPVSSVVITPALAGPFDLGNVVVRAPLYIDHETAVLTAKSDPIPTILKGIPLKLRSVTINVDKPGFIVNPTNCTPMTASASIGSSNGATATPSNRFQVGGCGNLKFSPKLQVQLKGGTRRNGNPSLIATLDQAAGQANIGRVSVALPHSEFLEQGHIRTVCTRVRFAAEQCPKGSIYGHAEAISPLLEQPLRGQVYLRSSSHKLPDLVAALKGPPSQPIEIDLDGRIDSIHGGIRTTFEAVPDAPVSKFVLRMQGGKKSLLVNSTNICRGTHKATVEMTGQNALRHNFQTPLKAQCGKKKSKKPKKSGKK